MTPLLTKIERHLRAHKVTAARFGREAVRDPRLVFDLRRGREPRDRLTARVLGFMGAATAAPPGATPATIPGDAR